MWPILQGKVKNDPEKSAATLAAFKKACAEYLPKMTQADIAEGNNVFCVIDDMRYELENEVRDAKRAKETAQRIAREVKDPLKAKLKALEDAKDQALEDSGEEDDAKEDNKGSGTPREFPVTVTVGHTKVEVVLILKAGTEVAVKETKEIEAMDQATAIQKYEDAFTSLLVHVRTGRPFDFDLQTQFHMVSLDAEPYRKTPEYRDAVLLQHIQTAPPD
jgi:hypothetical protein